jgi:hypothetical protein
MVELQTFFEFSEQLGQKLILVLMVELVSFDAMADYVQQIWMSLLTGPTYDEIDQHHPEGAFELSKVGMEG